MRRTGWSANLGCGERPNDGRASSKREVRGQEPDNGRGMRPKRRGATGAKGIEKASQPVGLQGFELGLNFLLGYEPPPGTFRGVQTQARGGATPSQRGCNHSLRGVHQPHHYCQHYFTIVWGYCQSQNVSMPICVTRETPHLAGRVSLHRAKVVEIDHFSHSCGLELFLGTFHDLRYNVLR